MFWRNFTSDSERERMNFLFVFFVKKYDSINVTWNQGLAYQLKTCFYEIISFACWKTSFQKFRQIKRKSWKYMCKNVLARQTTNYLASKLYLLVVFFFILMIWKFSFHAMKSLDHEVSPSNVYFWKASIIKLLHKALKDPCTIFQKNKSPISPLSCTAVVKAIGYES